jgi:class 3 adenylate cyclase
VANWGILTPNRTHVPAEQVQSIAVLLIAMRVASVVCDTDGMAPGLAERPSGTVAFLFADIENSPLHWASRPDEMSTALAQHDQLARSIGAARFRVQFLEVVV